MKKTVIIPAGIGDFSWIWSKLVHVKEEIAQFNVVDGWPHRTVPYIEMCGMAADYAPIDYQTLQMNMALHKCETWEDYRQFDAETMAVSANRHLELGRPLADWLPDLPTAYHYPLTIGRPAWNRAKMLLSEFRRPIVGISCASYRGSELWKTWGRLEWVEFLGKLMCEGWTPVLLGGFWDDLTHSVGCTLEVADIVGKTNVEEGMAILDQLDAYIGFSSGLGIVRTVLRKSAMMLWPDFQAELSTSWVSPEMRETGQYVASLWQPVDDVWPVAKQYLKRSVS
jgi:hypothetical protein